MKNPFSLLISLSFVLMSSACSVYTYDDYATYEEKEVIQTSEPEKKHFGTGVDDVYIAGDVVLIDEYNTEATVILPKPSTYVSAEVTDVKICRSSKDCQAYINERPWIPERLNNDITTGFKYDVDTNTFTHNAFGLDISLYIISMRFYNPTDSDQTIPFVGFCLMERDPKTGFFKRLNIPEMYLCASEEDIENDRYIMKPGETFETDLLSLQFSERILTTYKDTDTGFVRIADTEEYDDYEVYLRLNLSGRKEIQGGENFIKITDKR